MELPNKILQARIKLMLDHPYLASAVARFPVVSADNLGGCDTLATDGYYIYINTDFCISFSQEEIAFLFAHEIMHCVLGHIDRKGERDPEVWNQAIDYATNLLLVQFGLKMPKIGLFNKRYEGMTAEDIYGLLETQKASPSTGGIGEESGQAASCRTPGGFDQHVTPGDIRGQHLRDKDFPTPEERKYLRISLTNELKSKFPGTIAGLMASEIQKATKSQIPWRVLLSRFFTGIRRDDYRLMPPNKKHIARGIYLPSIGVPGPSHIVVTIDTSGSMSDVELSKILAEIDALRSVTLCALTLIQCDAKIQRIEEYDEYTGVSFKKYTFLGRGGTDFKPVFKWISENIGKKFSTMDALIYLTDGMGSFPDKAPNYPVLWIMTDGGSQTVPFGAVIRMSSSGCAVA